MSFLSTCLAAQVYLVSMPRNLCVCRSTFRLLSAGFHSKQHPPPSAAHCHHHHLHCPVTHPATCLFCAKWAALPLRTSARAPSPASDRTAPSGRSNASSTTRCTSCILHLHPPTLTSFSASTPCALPAVPCAARVFKTTGGARNQYQD